MHRRSRARKLRLDALPFTYSIELRAYQTRIRLLIPHVPRTITVCVRPSRS
jgi:hypothetical protein